MLCLKCSDSCGPVGVIHAELDFEKARKTRNLNAMGAVVKYCDCRDGLLLANKEYVRCTLKGVQPPVAVLEVLNHV